MEFQSVRIGEMEHTAQQTIMDEVTTFLLSRPTIEQIAEYKVSEAAQLRLSYLLEANRKNTLTEAERDEMDDASAMNHFLIMLKAKARKELAQTK